MPAWRTNVRPSPEATEAFLQAIYLRRQWQFAEAAEKAGEAAILCRYLDIIQCVRLTYLEPRPGFVWSNPPEHNGVDNHAQTDLVPVTPIAAPRIAPDPGLYATLGLDPAVPDAAIQTAYRRRAAKLLRSGATNTHAMRELNVAYEVLGNPVRREEYDRVRVSQSITQSPPAAIRTGAKSRVTQNAAQAAGQALTNGPP